VIVIGIDPHTSLAQSAMWRVLGCERARHRIHINAMHGEEDLSPRGPFTHAVGDRRPSIPAPSVLRHDGTAELGVGGSNQIRTTARVTPGRWLWGGYQRPAAASRL
jgi:hypothetical protein